MPYGFPSLSPLMDCHFYTSANGERACSRVRLMFFDLLVKTGAETPQKQENATL